MKSIIYSVDKETLHRYITESQTIGQVLKHFGLQNRGANHKTLKRRIQEENLDISHFKKFKFGGGWNKGTTGVSLKRKSLDEAMTTLFVNPTTKGKQKQYIRFYNLIPEICDMCKIGKEWNGLPLTLELDHIDGENTNNLLSNLRWVCPNCHFQTSTFRGRKLRKRYLCECGKEMLKESKHCHSCNAKLESRKSVRPDKETLTNLIQTTSFVKISKMYGVSDKSVRNWCKFYGIS